MMLERIGSNQSVVIDPSSDALEIIKKLFREQRFNVHPYKNDPTQLEAIKIITPGKPRKGRLHFSIIPVNNSILIYGFKDRYFKNNLVIDHASNRAKKEMGRLQGIIAKALAAESSELVVTKEEELKEYSSF